MASHYALYHIHTYTMAAVATRPKNTDWAADDEEQCTSGSLLEEAKD
jgi:hypothetical protein